MTSADLPAFAEAFQGLRRVFHLRGSDADISQMLADYFRAFRAYALADVQAAADTWTAKGAKFPKPAEWIAVMPRREGPGEHRQMPMSEAREYRRAELEGYEDAPCDCKACVHAGVNEKPLRFVPDVDSDGRDLKAYDPIGKRIVTVGHWAHGEELAGYYAAKLRFWEAMFHRFGAQGPQKKKRIQKEFEQRMREIYNEPKRPNPPLEPM